MGVPVLVRGLRLAVAALGVAALITALLQSTGSVANFFSYFTVESNVLAVVLLAGGAVLTRCPRGWPYFRGAVTLYLAITGIVYALLLSDVDVQLTSRWVNSTLHEIVPLFLLLIGLGMVLLALAVMRIGTQRLAAQSRSAGASTMSKRT